jgi:hypothetical protein
MTGGGLVFVYNADSGRLNALLDWGHKLVSPGTYACQLCALTYAPLGMKEEWRQAVAALGVPVSFLHRDELKQQHGLSGMDLPAVFREQAGRLAPWLAAEALRACPDLPALIALVRARLAQDGGG